MVHNILSRKNQCDDNQSGRLPLVLGELESKFEDKIKENRRFTISALHESFEQIPQSLLHEKLTKHLGYENCFFICL